MSLIGLQGICLVRDVVHTFCSSWPRRGLMLVTVGLCGLVAMEVGAAESSLKSAQEAFAKQQYAEALELLKALPPAVGASLEVRRLRTRTLVGLAHPTEALDEYDRYAHDLGHEDGPLLEDVAFQFIVPMLKDMRDQMRGAAYTALKELDNEAVIPLLEDGLSDGSGLVRALAAESIGLLPAGRHSSRLRKAYDDQAAMVRSNVVRTVGLNGDRKELPFLEQALNDEQPRVRVQAMGALLRFGKTDAWSMLEAASRAPNPEARSTALRVMGDLGDSRGLPLAIQASGDPMPSVRGASAATLGLYGNKEGLEALAKLVKDKIPAVRSSAAVALGDIKTEEAVSRLQQALRDTDPGVQGAAIDSLLRQGQPFPVVEPTVRSLLLANDPGPRSAVGKALAKGDGPNRPAALAYLEQLVHDALPRPRIAAARSLGRIGTREHIPILKQLLRDQDPAVQATAAAALIRLVRSGSHG